MEETFSHHTVSPEFPWRYKLIHFTSLKKDELYLLYSSL